MESVSCLVCGCHDHEPVHMRTGIVVPLRNGQERIDVTNVVCRRCGLIFYNPRPDPAMLARLVRDACRVITRPGRNLDRKVLADQMEFLRANMPAEAGGRALDVGSFEGEFLACLAHEGWDVLGVEPSSISAQKARERFGIEVIEALYDDGIEIEDTSFDLVSMTHVLEHVPYPLLTILLARRHLRPGGHLFIEVPDASNPFMPMLSDFFSYQHLSHFTPATLSTLLDRAGFTVEAVDGGLDHHAFRMLARSDPEADDVPRPFGVDPMERDRAMEIMQRYEQMRMELLEPIRERVGEFLSGPAADHAPVAIFGAGLHTHDLLSETDVSRANIVALLDNDPDKQGRQIFGYPVKPPRQIPRLGINGILVSSYAFSDEIASSLRPYEEDGIEIMTLYEEVRSYDGA